ncbi:MAG: hypothetical protein WD426_13830 [Anditalea sp.]
MANQKVISFADLSIINDALSSITSDLSGVNLEMGTLNQKQNQLENELVKFANVFADFVEVDFKHKTLQLAETRQSSLKQDLQINYGYYSEIRRMATGILQSVDTGVVGADTLKFTTEEVMIKAPGYWLAPALVALAAWVRNDKDNNEKALNEALKRNDYKTTLFFMLVMRRLSRNEASLKWLERYFMHQNPHHLDREFIVVLEAVTTGVFPPAARQLLMRNIKNWLDQLTQGDSFINEQKMQWISFFEAMAPLPDGKYPLLKQYAENWNSLEDSLNKAKTHEILKAHFRHIISSTADSSKGIKVQLDEILTLLVTHFDDEELPLREQVRFNQLIIEMDGDKPAAQAKMDAEKRIFHENVDFLQLLTNASFDAELSGATNITKALAVSISQPWIVEAHDTFTAQSRNKVPNIVELNIDGFTTKTKDGSEENELVKKQEAFYQGILKKEYRKLSFPYAGVIIGALVCLLGYWGFGLHLFVGLVGIGIGGVVIWNALNNYFKVKNAIKETIREREIKAKEVLRGCLAETVDYWKEHKTEDANAEVVRQLLSSIKPEDFSSLSKETARNIV